MASALSLAILCIAALILYNITQAIYNVFFHPLRHYPGPLLWRASRLPFAFANLRGTLPFDVLALTHEYGDGGGVIRIAPNELAYTDGRAWREILGHNPQGGDEVGKWTPFYRPVDSMPADIISADRALHGALRRQISHGFSDRAMRAQEAGVLRGHIDQLITQLRARSQSGEALDLCGWYNFTTFDIIGELAFGEPFGCLQSGELHEWVATLFELTKLGTYMQTAIHYPAIKMALINMIPKGMREVLKHHDAFTHEKVSKRIAQGKEGRRDDLIEGLLRKEEELQLTPKEIESHASLLIVAGSETTATILSGATYLLLTNRDKLERLTAEVRGAFAAEEEINIQTAGTKLPYMLACLDEALRRYPPVPVGLPRVVPKGGRTFLGRFVPEGTHVGIWQYATNHSAANWTDPEAYRPERFLGGDEGAKYRDDKKEALQPFSFGPRNCIGRNLAYAEMRLILARLLFNFDLKLAPQSENWRAEQKVFNLWHKPPLLVHLTPRE